MNSKKIIVAICGASGVVYGVRMAAVLMKMPISLYMIISPSARAILSHELAYHHNSMEVFLKENGCGFHDSASIYEIDAMDFFAPIASGSFQHHGMVIAPCSMNTAAAIASGLTQNVIHRAADVCLKEKRPLILIPRETPLSRIHLQNLLRLSDAGAIIMPAMPGFYHQPKTIEDLLDSIIARALDHLGLPNTISDRWGESESR